MGRYLTEDGLFRGPQGWCPPGFLVLDLCEERARLCARLYAEMRKDDPEMAEDILTSLDRPGPSEKRKNDIWPVILIVAIAAAIVVWISGVWF